MGLFDFFECCVCDRVSQRPVDAADEDAGEATSDTRCRGAADARLQAVVQAAGELLPEGRMTEWQRDWCTAETVAIYLNGRQGDVNAAAQILSQALAWRQSYKEILSGARMPQWQSDFRIFARAGSGEPLIYLCYRHHVAPRNVQAIVEHGACVLEAAIRSMRHGATKFDVFIDCHGFNTTHLDVRAVFPLMRMISQPFRDRLRTCTFVDAPRAFSFVYECGSKFVSEATRRKAGFATPVQAVDYVARVAGEEQSKFLERIIAENRIGTDCIPGIVPGRNLPSELPPEGDLFQRERSHDRDACGTSQQQVLRPMGGRGTRTLGAGPGPDACQKTLPRGWFCCRRRNSAAENAPSPSFLGRWKECWMTIA